MLRLQVLDRLDDEVAVLLRVDRLRERPGLERERDLLVLGYGLPLGDVQRAALLVRAGVERVLLLQRRKVRAGLELRVDRVRLGEILHEDVPHETRFGCGVRRRALVLVVVRLDLGRRDGDALRDCGRELVDDQLRTDALPELGHRVSLLLQLGVELLPVARVLLLHEARDERVDIRVRDHDVVRLRLLLVLHATHEIGRGLLLQRLILSRACLRERLRRRLLLVTRLRLQEQGVEVGPRDLLAVDDRNGVGRQRAPTATGYEQRTEGEKADEACEREAMSTHEKGVRRS